MNILISAMNIYYRRTEEDHKLGLGQHLSILPPLSLLLSPDPTLSWGDMGSGQRR